MRALEYNNAYIMYNVFFLVILIASILLNDKYHL